MSKLEKRLQILLDEDRFDRLSSESRVTGRTVGAIVRSSIDLHFASSTAVAERAAAARFLLDSTAEPQGSEPAWRESKAALEEDLDTKFRS